MNGVFAIHKPLGITSQDAVATLKRIFINAGFSSEQKDSKRRRNRNALKVGHGGTLDPLAEGTIVIGVGTGTKELTKYLGNCEKIYTAEAFLGASTTTYDSEGEVLEYGSIDPHSIKMEDLDAVLSMFRGDITQYPPIYSALKVNGIPLYTYARENKPLPRDIEPRECTVKYLQRGDLDLGDYTLPSPVTSIENRKFAETVQKRKISEPPTVQPPFKGAKLKLNFEVSSGTYIRSLIKDIGDELNTKAHMSKLVRDRQGKWEIGKNVLPLSFFSKPKDYWWPVLQTIFKEGPDRVLEDEYLNDKVETSEPKDLKKDDTETPEIPSEKPSEGVQKDEAADIVEEK